MYYQLRHQYTEEGLGIIRIKNPEKVVKNGTELRDEIYESWYEFHVTQETGDQTSDNVEEFVLWHNSCSDIQIECIYLETIQPWVEYN